MSSSITLHNIQDQETVHQRCLLVNGYCETAAAIDDGHIKITVGDKSGRTKFPEQTWPMCQGHFKALAILEPGENIIRFAVDQDGSDTFEISVVYVPLLQTPPLHLAIMVAKDSPLMMDCPPCKFGSLSTAHSSLDAAIAKLRVTAYMWQALTAEEMRSNGLGRRTFRLEEEWGRDTLSATFANQDILQTTAKVHLIRSNMTVAELRDRERAQQNPSARKADELHSIFTEALLAHGAPFLKESHPVVAGMILDSHYDANAKLITAHAALGAHDSKGLSLGIFGSHLTYSWPRFMEEIPNCLLDAQIPGDRVGNDNGECVSLWEACSVGQGAFLHEVGHAFSAPHSSGIMMRGYSKDWPKCFLSRTAYCRHTKCDGIVPVTDATPNDCHWDVRDLLRFRSLRHFRHPSDKDVDDSPPSFELREDEDFLGLTISSGAGLARITFNKTAEAEPSVASPVNSVYYTVDQLEGRFNPEKPLELEVTSMNGKHRTLNVWKFFRSKSFIRIPGTGIRLTKQGFGDEEHDDQDCPWLVMLHKKGKGVSLVAAKKIDIRVGCGLDGAVVHYKDGTSAPCGRMAGSHPTWDMGGHQAKKMAIPKGVDIVKVAVSGPSGWGLSGLRMFLSDGKAMGALNKSDGGEVRVLAPEDGQKIVGFYGTSGTYGMCKEFGILTMDKNQELTASAYDFLESQGNQKSKSGRKGGRADEMDDDSDDSTSEDEDDGYDNESDTDTI